MTVPAQIGAAQALLDALGMDAQRCNRRSALTLLALLRLGPDDDWSQASNPMLGTRALMDWMRDQYAAAYAANSGETIRRYTLHQFAEAHLVVPNPDQPDRPNNSSYYNYQVTQEALSLIQLYGRAEF